MNMREQRIDMIRGLAVVIIIINHLTWSMKLFGLQGWRIPTPTNFGFSSAAEIFVMLSGYMAGMVYLQKENAAKLLLARSWTLYKWNTVLFIAVLPFLASMSGEELKLFGFELFDTSPVSAVALFFPLLYAPYCVNVLQLYIVLMLAAAAIMPILQTRALLVLLISLALYGSAQVLSYFDLQPGYIHFAMNPFAWQLLFIVPMIGGRNRAHQKLFNFFEKRSYLVAALLLMILVMFVARRTPAISQNHLMSFLSSHDYLGLLRLMESVLMLTFYAAAFAVAGKLLALAPFQILASIGRHSLLLYVISVWTTYALALAWDRFGGTHDHYLAAVAASLLLTVGIARLADRRKEKRRPQSLGQEALAS